MNLYCTGKTAEQVCCVLFAELKPSALKLIAFGEDGFSGNRS